ncbi:hypothetical protein BCE_2147 [Bacillus cereus ATCC 10987]|uniref:Uncharacterized protein n=1 Tax=Bacillus cereus (strain ATCC 10987 / NRS 248) TaxID=222523 RepID=Q739J3_BACC1|nr:hypothetical protein BCE_2147 [Bacillus cereus ATCC 10987]
MEREMGSRFSFYFLAWFYRLHVCGTEKRSFAYLLKKFKNFII